MPHVYRKALARKIRTAEDSTRQRNRKGPKDLLKYGEESVSEAIEEVKPQDWAEKVYKPDILDNLEKLYKKPRYTM